MQQLLGSGGNEPFRNTARLGEFKVEKKRRVGEFKAENIDGSCSSCLAEAATSRSIKLRGSANSKPRRSSASENSKPRDEALTGHTAAAWQRRQQAVPENCTSRRIRSRDKAARRRIQSPETNHRRAMQQLLGNYGNEPFQNTARRAATSRSRTLRVGKFKAERTKQRRAMQELVGSGGSHLGRGSQRDRR